ncbi:hypothetical protein [Bremerella alba]|nr:hypothetical protein [Bremerella alba]
MKVPIIDTKELLDIVVVDRLVIGSFCNLKANAKERSTTRP